MLVNCDCFYQSSVSVKVNRETGNAGSVLTVAGFDIQVDSSLSLECGCLECISTLFDALVSTRRICTLTITTADNFDQWS